ncbi:hypothetical protein Cgig2_032791 [Carnegiea gigantea]|uniref:Cytosolic endo-beta-N-acetylglucosaminidase TIM barrel domain-containing protein n=1 Tax=Carnegiea gigantea TaxID=171969 RepID=A0A9Q1Q932_9CARY|nr:hypothetical protein Cgig2_032791 [Carnegiea gigantea]
MASESPSIYHPSELSDQNPPEFDPSQPSIPISYPLKSLEDLESRSYFSSFHYPFNKASVPLESNSALPNRRRMLVCHDMAGGYLDDKWVQGDTNADGYAIWHWYLMDVFVYFSHNLVTLPPPCWVNAAHKHGIKVLGTFITEWDAGRTICDKLLSTKESAHTCAERLSELAIALGFDGWLNAMSSSRASNFLPRQCGLPGALAHHVAATGLHAWHQPLPPLDQEYHEYCTVGPNVAHTLRKEVGYDTNCNALTI